MSALDNGRMGDGHIGQWVYRSSTLMPNALCAHFSTSPSPHMPIFPYALDYFLHFLVSS